MTENASFNRYFDGRPVEPMTAYEKAEAERVRRLEELERRVAKLEETVSPKRYRIILEEQT
jgi:hypothetical protein